MFKAKISNFIKNNEEKIKDLGTKLLILVIIIFIGVVIFSTSTVKNNSQNISISTQIYRPQETVIKGKEISDVQYKEDNNLVQTFLDYCNEKKVEEAYNLLSDGCKKDVYPTLEIFKNAYYNNIFTERREFNLQSWISTKKYTVYRIRYVADILSTGTYEEDNVHQDYITLVKKSEGNKIAIGEYIETEELGTKTKTDEIEAIVIKRDISLDSERYKIQVKNDTNNTIMLDTLQNNQTIKLIGKRNGAYAPFLNKIFQSDVTIEPGATKIIDITFNKPCSSDNISDHIKLYRVIRDYDEYINNRTNYTDTFSVQIDI